MTVLVHLNHGVDKSYMLHFGNKVTKRAIREVMRLGQDDAAQAIYGYANLLDSVRKTKIPDKEKSCAGLEADFVVGASE